MLKEKQEELAMKRLLSLALVFSLAICLTGCGLFREDTMPVFTTVPPEPTPPPTIQPDPYADQLDLIWQEMDSWIQDPYADVWCYAVTDLDGNGRLEIISSDTQGSSHFVTTRLLEVSEDLTSLMTIQGSGSSDNISLTASYAADGPESILCHYDPADNVWFYVQESTIQLSATEYAESRTAISLQEGNLSRIVLGSKVTAYPDGGGSPTETWLDGQGKPISQAGYDATLNAYSTTAQIGWLECIGIENLTRDMLDTSWAQFSRP